MSTVLRILTYSAPDIILHGFGTMMVRASMQEQGSQVGPGRADQAFDRADGTTADIGGRTV